MDSNRDVPFLLVTYDCVDMRVVAVDERYTADLLRKFEHDMDLLRYPAPSRVPPSRKRLASIGDSEVPMTPTKTCCTRNTDPVLPLHWRALWPCSANSNVHAQRAYVKHKSAVSAGGETLLAHG